MFSTKTFIPLKNIDKYLLLTLTLCLSIFSQQLVQASNSIDQQLSVITDEQARSMLHAELTAKELQQTKKASLTFYMLIQETVSNTQMAFEDAFKKLANIHEAYYFIIKVFQEEKDNTDSFMLFLIKLCCLMLIILSAEYLALRLTPIGKPQRLHESQLNQHGQFSSLTRILLSRLAGVLIFYTLSSLVLPLIFLQGSFLLLSKALVDYLTVARLTYIFCAFFFAPSHPQLRLFNLDDQPAKSLLRRLVIVSLFSATSIFTELAKDLGLPQGVYKLGFWANLISYIAMATAVFLSKDGIKMMLLHANIKNSPQRIWFANAWPFILISSIIIVWFTLELVVANIGFDDDIVYAATLTLLAIIAVPFFDVVLISIVSSFKLVDNDSSNSHKDMNNSFKESLLRIFRITTFLSIAFIFSLLWGIDYLNLSTQGLAAIIITKLIEVVFLLLTGLIVWEITNVFIQHKLTKELPNSDEQSMDSEGGQGLSRIATILPLIRNTLAFLIFVISIITALSTMGINTTALLAGASVLGLAIGFGAQTLVKDIVSGVFFLVDDAFRMGEYIVIGTTKGTVEKIALRSLRLRHHLGALHTIPYGEIPSLTNYSRDWVIMKLPFRVPHDSDINQIKKLFKALGKELLEHPELGQDFIEPFKSQGVLDVDEVGLLIRGKFTCKPGTQFMIRKQVYLRVQQIFADNNIEFAKRKVEVQMPKDLPPSAIAPLTAAATEAMPNQTLPTTT
mgnify:CR=1 FL=1